MLKPTDCNFMFCLPLSKNEFDGDLKNTQKDFLKTNQGLNWEHYDSEILGNYRDLKCGFENFGFEFSERVTFQDFLGLKDKYHVNIIFSHCKSRNEIEFFDRLVDDKEFIESIPLNYSGFIDLSVCQPILIAERLREERKKTKIKYTEKIIEAERWLLVYKEVFDVIKNEKAPFYSNAIEIALDNLLKEN